MKVVRTGEVGDFAPQTGLQCGCYFDFKTTGKTDLPAVRERRRTARRIARPATTATAK